MNRASPSDLRKALQAAKAYTDAGILFVPVPVFSDDEIRQAVQLAAWRIGLLEKELAAKEGATP